MRILKPLPGALPRPERNIIGDWPMNSLGNEIFDRIGNRHNADFGPGVASPNWQPGKSGHCIYFDGNDYIIGRDHIGHLFLPLTVVASVSCSVAGSYYPIFSSHDFNDRYYGIMLMIDMTNKVWIQYGDGTGNGLLDRNTKLGTTVLLANKNYHIVGVIRGKDDMDIYIDGVNDGGAYSGMAAAMDGSETNSRPVFGRTMAILVDQFLTGCIEYVSLINQALLPADVNKIYREQFYRYPESRVFAVA